MLFYKDKLRQIIKSTCNAESPLTDTLRDCIIKDAVQNVWLPLLAVRVIAQIMLSAYEMTR